MLANVCVRYRLAFRSHFTGWLTDPIGSSKTNDQMDESICDRWNEISPKTCSRTSNHRAMLVTKSITLYTIILLSCIVTTTTYSKDVVLKDAVLPNCAALDGPPDSTNLRDPTDKDNSTKNRAISSGADSNVDPASVDESVAAKQTAVNGEQNASKSSSAGESQDNDESKKTVDKIGNQDSMPDEISFNFHVRQILSENCFFCHGPDENHRYADLRLDNRDGALEAIEPGDPESSELLSRILDEDDTEYQMPPPESGRKLSRKQKEILRKWIEQGANYETHWAFTPPTKPKIPTVNQTAWPRNEIDHFVLAKLESKGIQPSPRARPDKIIRRMYTDLLGFAPSIDEVRAFEKDYASDAGTAIDRLADQLLDSPHYGERMALPWLDAARYSDSNGFQEDGDRMQWPWRDWVVNAMNNDMPFDQFTIEQLAGDQLPLPTQEQLIATAFNRNHMLNGEGGALKEEQRNNYVFDRVDTTATTWLGMTMACAQCHDHKYDPITQEDYYKFFAFFNNLDESGGVDIRISQVKIARPYLELSNDTQKAELKQLNKEISEQQKFLANHKSEIDAEVIAWEEDYHAGKVARDIPRNIFKHLDVERDQRNDSQNASIRVYFLDNVARGKWHDEQKKLREIERKKRKLRATIPNVMVMRERKDQRKTHVLNRGNYESLGQEVMNGIPGFLNSSEIDDRIMNRLDLAKWLVSEENPLTSRVQVNRYWQLFFGVGLVKTSEDFGVQGELPTHPDLLDWLAVDFYQNDWRVKRLHKMIVTSETYLQSSKNRTDLNELDPDNRLLARSPRFRLSAMAIRDTALRVSGLLNSEIGGPPVYPTQPDGLWKEFSLERFSYKPSRGDDLYRRSLYTFWRRTVPPPNMFDSSSRQVCSVRQSRTNTPLQALVMLNDATYVEAACHLAQEILAVRDLTGSSASHNVTSGKDLSDAGELGAMEEHLRAVFQRCLGRQPNAKHLATLRSAWNDSFVHFQANSDDARRYISVGSSFKIPENKSDVIRLASLASVVQIIMNTDEFITRE